MGGITGLLERARKLPPMDHAKLRADLDEIIDPRLFDALIAATARANDLPVYTASPDDFAAIDGLDVVAVSADR